MAREHEHDDAVVATLWTHFCVATSMSSILVPKGHAPVPSTALTKKLLAFPPFPLLAFVEALVIVLV